MNDIKYILDYYKLKYKITSRSHTRYASISSNTEHYLLHYYIDVDDFSNLEDYPKCLLTSFYKVINKNTNFWSTDE